MGRYLDIIRREPTEQPTDCERSERSERRAVSASAENHEGGFFRLIRFFRTPEELEHWCPARIEPADWQQVIEDGRKFLVRWGMQSEALGRTARELFRLHQVAERLAPSYSRLSRYDETGLIWLLRGRAVVALTAIEAAIQGATAVLVYRKLNKPALGPLGDSPGRLGVSMRPRLLSFVDGVIRDRPVEATQYHGVPAGPPKNASTAICRAAPPAQRMALAVVHNEKHESNLIGRAPE